MSRYLLHDVSLRGWTATGIYDRIEACICQQRATYMKIYRTVMLFDAVLRIILTWQEQ